jgi:hypothetical protein
MSNYHGKLMDVPCSFACSFDQSWNYRAGHHAALRAAAEIAAEADAEIAALRAANKLLRGLLSAALSVVESDNAHEDTGQLPLSVTLASGVHFDLVAARQALRDDRQKENRK